ncbi:MAG TPA: S-layer homology domain-containing protein [Chloroflexia bacterium]
MPLMKVLAVLMLMSVTLLPQWVSARPNPNTQPVLFEKSMQDISVSTNSDVLDAAGGVCTDVTPMLLPGPDGVTSLREAICASNNNPGADTVSFDIPGTGVHTINLLSQLPDITGPVTIDGYTQPGAMCNTLPNATNASLKVVLVDVDANYGTGLKLVAGSDSSTVRGLVFQRFSVGIYVWSQGDTISGNFIGTNAAGSAAAEGSNIGIYVSGADGARNLMIGGNDLCDRNLISGNGTGLYMDGYADQNTIINNLLGTDAAGIQPIGNYFAIVAGSAGNVIGGSDPGSGNVISGNHYGIILEGGTTSIQGNWIGVGADHTAPMGNEIAIRISYSSNNLIGGTGTGQAANLIAYSLIANVSELGMSSNPVGNAIRANSIYGVTGLGIDLGGSGVTPNDLNDEDEVQNFPVLTGVTGGTIEGTLNSKDNRTFAIDFFASPTCSPWHYGQGQMYLGSMDVTTVNYNADFTFNGLATPDGWFTTATATDLTTGDTSEFARCFQDTTQQGIEGTAYLDSPTPGNEAANASVYACTYSTPTYCTSPVWTDATGHYEITDLAPGTFDIFANPPGGAIQLPDHLTGIMVVQNAIVSGQDIVFPNSTALPPGVGISPVQSSPGGVLLVYSSDEISISAEGCPRGSATYDVRQYGQVIRSGPMTEHLGGTISRYTATIPPFNPVRGPITILIVIHCPDGSTLNFDFDVYIDPSGVVQSFLPDGTPAALPMATVILYRSDDPNAVFEQVEDGSAIMSPGNRTNPDMSGLGGKFGWDVVPGYYKVRAQKAGCVKVDNPSQEYVDTRIMVIPPPVTDLVLQLDCGSPTFTDVRTGDYFYNAATYLAAIGVLSGYGNTSQCPTGVPCFLPSNNVTRGQAAKIIANAAGLADVIPDTQQTFQDVDPTTNAFWVYIERMAVHGYIGGYRCGGPGEECMPGNKPYFRWGNNITRNQLAKILVLANQYTTINPAEPHFQDVLTTNGFYAFVETAYDKGLIGGYRCGGPGEECMPDNKPYFRGGANATRGQLAKMVTQTLISPAP